jgi:hypothetical protein
VPAAAPLLVVVDALAEAGGAGAENKIEQCASFCDFLLRKKKPAFFLSLFQMFLVTKFIQLEGKNHHLKHEFSRICIIRQTPQFKF